MKFSKDCTHFLQMESFEILRKLRKGFEVCAIMMITRSPSLNVSYDSGG